MMAHPQWENLSAEISRCHGLLPSIVICSSGVFFLSLCALGCCDLCGLPGICQRFLVHQDEPGAKVSLNAECVHHKAANQRQFGC